MAVPATTGKLCTTIQEMEIGDFIYATVDSSGNWVFGDTLGKPELPVTAVAVNSSNKTHWNYYWYMIKVDKGFLISDRVWYHTVSWDTLNGWKNIQGITITSNQGNGIIRSLTGGVAYADVNGNKATTDQGFGAWPTNNEWDKYIVNFPIDKIQEGKTLDDVFHWSGVYSWCQDTTVNGLNLNNVASNNTFRVNRGNGSAKYFNYAVSNGSYNIVGFRPVFEYKEV